jgi:hypothetical protein
VSPEEEIGLKFTSIREVVCAKGIGHEGGSAHEDLREHFENLPNMLPRASPCKQRATIGQRSVGRGSVGGEGLRTICEYEGTQGNDGVAAHLSIRQKWMQGRESEWASSGLVNAYWDGTCLV